MQGNLDQMVVFTCNECGESLKKAKVDLHYRTKCPRCNVRQTQTHTHTHTHSSRTHENTFHHSIAA